MAKEVVHITILKPTPREFVRLWNQVRQALEKQLANGARISCPTSILSLQYAPDMLQKVELVVNRFVCDEDNCDIVQNLRVYVSRKEEFINVTIEKK